MRYQITSDSTCDLSPEQLERYNIRLLPLYVSMDGKTLRDGVDVKPDDIYAHVSAGGSLPQTAAVNLADYVRAFTELSEKNDFVIHVCISLDFSCCYQNAKLAAADFDNVYVVDSRNLSTGHGLVVLEAERMAREGMEPDDIVAALHDLTGRVEASFILDRLDYMKKGGRCSAVTLLGANLLKLRPCIEVKDGKMGIGKKYRGSFDKCVCEYITDKIGNRSDLELRRVFITHSGGVAQETLDALNDKESVHQRALELGIPVPREYDGTPESYPVVVKPHCGEKFGLKAADRYAVANNEAEFDAIMEKMQRYDPSPIVQQKITGAGAGVSLLLGRESELLGALCHRRVREYPITGGPSTCCESFYDEKMIDEAYELLKSFHFTGLAMVEFKGDCILEVNPRVWGSFPMTEAAQSPIVAHYAQTAQGGQVTYTAKDYRTGVKMRFFLNDTVAALSYLKAGRVKEGLRGLGDFFTAKEALSAKGDGKVMRAYLKKSLFER